MANDGVASNATASVSLVAAEFVSAPSVRVTHPFTVQVVLRTPPSCARPCHARVLVPVSKSLPERSAGKADAKGYRTLPIRLRVSTRAANGRRVARVRVSTVRVRERASRDQRRFATSGQVARSGAHHRHAGR